MGKIIWTKTLYTQSLIASEGNVTATRLEESLGRPGLHDRITRWLARSQLTPGQLWEAVAQFVTRHTGWLILDDSVLDKPFGPKIGLATWQYSGAHHDVVHGIGLLTLLWTNGTVAIPVNYRLYAKTVDGKSKHDHARELLTWAKGQGFAPDSVLMDSWYSASQTLRLIQSFGWHWLAELRSNRRIVTTAGRACHLTDLEAPDRTGGIVHLKDVGYVRVAKSVDQQNGRVRYLCTSDTTTKDVSLAYARRWDIETYHRAVKQLTEIANCQARRARSQRNHIFCSLLAFVALQAHALTTNQTIYRVKRSFFDPLIRTYLGRPTVSLAFAGVSA